MARIVKRALCALACIAIVVIGSESAASAHTHKDPIHSFGGGVIIYYGYVEMNNAHTTIKVCDDKADNHGVWVEFYYHRTGAHDDDYNRISDGNGSQSGCGQWSLPPNAYFVGYQGGHASGSSSWPDASGWNWGGY